MNRQVIFPIPSFTGQAGSSKCPAQVDFAVVLHYRTPCRDFSRVKGCWLCTCTPRGNCAAHHASISPTGLQSGRETRDQPQEEFSQQRYRPQADTQHHIPSSTTQLSGCKSEPLCPAACLEQPLSLCKH